MASLPPLEPWALDPESRRLCLLYGRSLQHRIGIRIGDKLHVCLKRDRFVAISDRHLASLANVEVTRHASPRGFYHHRVLTAAGWKEVFENAKTGGYTMQGRGRRFELELTFNPTPPILSIMRAKVPPQAELLQRPEIPAPRLTPTRRELTEGELHGLADAGRAADPTSRSEREMHGAQLKFIRPTEG
jgi:hypothetical protein